MSEYYDARLLRRAVLPVDIAIRKTRINPYRVERTPSRMWASLYDVTPGLVSEFEKEARAHVGENRDGYLYFVAENDRAWFNAAHFEYEQFPLMRDRESVLRAVRAIARDLSPVDTTEFDATCLYLLYFYGIVANPDCTWVLMDYLTNGNRHHQHGTRIGWNKPEEERTVHSESVRTSESDESSDSETRRGH